jgi:predicted AAA+ superfamily ATPase
MLKRKIANQLLEWKKRSDKVCLMVKGARQAGKTFIIDKFAKENYKNYIYINFEQNPSLKDIFSGDLDIETLIKQITINIKGIHLIPNETLIFLDEIQSCPQARTALKFFAIDKRFDIIASGSLLGINYKEVSSYPTGYEEVLNMSSLDFEEFLWANGVSGESISSLFEYFDNGQVVPEAIHSKMFSLLKEYIVVGGMPAVVDDFVNNHDFNSVLSKQRAIISNYENDIAKYAPFAEKSKARSCFLSIPRQLAKEYKKFQFSIVEKQGAARKYEGSLLWLYDAGIINYCNNVSVIEFPFEGNVREGFFKIYMQDIGLLTAMLEDGSAKDIINGNLGIYKGAIYENLIADIFTKQGKRLYYYGENNRLEIDFLIRYKDKPAAVEVKSGKNKSRSLAAILENSPTIQAIKLSSNNVGETDKIKTFPLYMAMFL